MDYGKQLVEVGGFNLAAQHFFDGGGNGLNITSPFKYDAFQFADELSERARLAEAVNTLSKQDNGKVIGDNTDSVGLLNHITKHLGWLVESKRILILGAGGAVRGVLYPFLQAKPETIVIANRTVSKAHELAHRFGEFGSISGCSYEGLGTEQNFDIIINATSASLHGHALPVIPKNCVHAQTAYYDMSYANTLTPFLDWAKSVGAAHYSDGLGMLLSQAAESFTIWTGLEPDIWSLESLVR